MKRSILTLFVIGTILGLSATSVRAHCQIPCGIYNDPVRFTLLEEDLTTIEKSMKEIIHLSEDHDQPNYNQIVRWVQNKEDHAAKFTEIVTYYFMAQRVKPADPTDAAATEKYHKQVALLHQMVVHAMKAKQTTDLKEVDTLRSLVSQFKAAYLGAQ